MENMFSILKHNIEARNPNIETLQEIAKDEWGKISQTLCRELASSMPHRIRCILAEFIPLVIETFGGFGREFQIWINNLTLLTEHHLTLVDGESLINKMLDMIALQVVSSNGKIQQSWAPLTDERD